ncbi:MAG: thymidylate synthase, partial [Enterococcus faecium]|nr:thymidylate synthase [Enterococcus faecium]
MAKFSDDGSILQGAYGPKIVPLIDDLIQLLKNDTGTRRAVIPLYSADDLGKESKDIPCTLSLEFLIRNNKLHLITNMRSNDIFLGLPYDIFSFTMLQEYIAYQLGVDLGCYYHYVGSLHVYQRNFKKIEEISQMSPHETAIFNKSDSIFKNFSEIIDLEESIRK